MTMPPLLPSDGPAEFLAAHLEPHIARWDLEGEAHDRPEPSYEWAATGDLLADDGARLRAEHTRLVTAECTPPAAAAKYLVAWYGGRLAESVGFVYAMTGAGVLTDSTVRWRRHPQGWIDRVDIGTCRMVVPERHPWAARNGVWVVADDIAVRTATIAALAGLLTPVLNVCRSTARVGWNSLWTEVADGLGMALVFTPRFPRASSALTSLNRLLATPGAPWRTQPDLWLATTESGPLMIGRKGGCCLAFTADRAPLDPADPALDESLRAFLQRFPIEAGRRDYCSTCSIRDRSDVEARQRFWVAQRGLLGPASS